MAPEDTLLAALATDPGDDFAWQALADCLEEQGREQQAELTRLRESLRRAAPRSRGRRQRERRLQLLLSQGVVPVVPQLEIELNIDVTMTFCLVPPGSFWMGSPSRETFRYQNEGPRHLVRLTRGFWLGRTPITIRQWRAMQNQAVERRRAEHPVTGITWEQIREVCRDLRRRTRRPVRLPLEAEWEYACRATTRTPFCSGSLEEDAHRVGWHKVGGGRTTHAVGRNEPNAWGLYDMHGSVWEWCLDGRREFTAAEVTDPVYQLEEQTVRVLRGGSYDNFFRDARAACRGWAMAAESAVHWGARLAISLDDGDPILRVFHAD